MFVCVRHSCAYTIQGSLACSPPSSAAAWTMREINRSVNHVKMLADSFSFFCHALSFFFGQQQSQCGVKFCYCLAVVVVGIAGLQVSVSTGRPRRPQRAVPAINEKVLSKIYYEIIHKNACSIVRPSCR